MLFTSKRSFFRHYDREVNVASVFPIPFAEATTRTGMRSRAIKSEYLPLDRTTRLMKIPIVTPLVLRQETFRHNI